MKKIILFFISLTVGLSTFASDIDFAPPAYENKSGQKLVPIDIQSVEVTWIVADGLESLTGIALVNFRTSEKGYPFLLLNPSSKAYKSNTKEKVVLKKITEEQFKAGNYFSLDGIYAAGEHSITVEFNYIPDPKKSHFLPVEYYNNQFAEMGIPSNLRYDHYSIDLKVDMTRLKKIEPLVISNGMVKEISPKVYHIAFGPEFTSMGIYIDLLDKSKVFMETSQLDSIKAPGAKVEMIVYSTWDKEGLQGFSKALPYEFPELEKTFGPYPLDRLIIKTFEEDPAKGGGAFTGAISVSIDYTTEIYHEIGHTWFMQGLGGQIANDQWFYEGLGTWAPTFLPGLEFDAKYEKSIDLLANPYAISETDHYHAEGQAVLAAIQTRLLKNGGQQLLPLLVELYNYRMSFAHPSHRIVSTRDFKDWVEGKTSVKLDDIFDFYFKSY